mmetsp:Transcript_15852/g.45789  ORF Transcript_15852/g.45789 Transcript_15852/m.45789 type:complete len:277 (-) Transcript_15852:65-895(-)
MPAASVPPVAASWMSCSACWTCSNVPMHMNRRSALFVLDDNVMREQPVCSVNSLMLPPCLPTTALANLPGMTKCTCTASGSSGMVCTSLCVGAARSVRLGSPVRAARPAPNARARPLPMAVGAPVTVSMRSGSAPSFVSTGSRSTWIRTPVVSRTSFSRSPPLPMICPVNLLGIKIATSRDKRPWPAAACWSTRPAAAPMLPGWPVSSTRRGALRSSPASCTVIFTPPELSRISFKPAPALPITRAMLSPGINTVSCTGSGGSSFLSFSLSLSLIA